jgi:anthranilate phosphoribosyltransferase
MYAYLYQDTNTNFTILHSLDGYDVSLTLQDDITPKMEGMLNPENFGVKLCNK